MHLVHVGLLVVIRSFIQNASPSKFIVIVLRLPPPPASSPLFFTFHVRTYPHPSIHSRAIPTRLRPLLQHQCPASPAKPGKRMG